MYYYYTTIILLGIKHHHTDSREFYIFVYFPFSSLL